MLHTPFRIPPDDEINTSLLTRLLHSTNQLKKYKYVYRIQTKINRIDIKIISSRMPRSHFSSDDSPSCLSYSSTWFTAVMPAWFAAAIYDPGILLSWPSSSQPYTCTTTTQRRMMDWTLLHRLEPKCPSRIFPQQHLSSNKPWPATTSTYNVVIFFLSPSPSPPSSASCWAMA